MQANPEKFQFLVLSPFQNEAKFQYILDLPGTQLQSVLQAPLLGVIIDTQLKSDICSTNVPTFCVQCMVWCMCGQHSMNKSICKHEITGSLPHTYASVYSTHRK